MRGFLALGLVFDVDVDHVFDYAIGKEAIGDLAGAFHVLG
jgi:hypothetical protein